MTELRRQLEDARTEYRAARYDGDLATDLLPEKQMNPWSAARLRLFMPAVVGAIAALLAVAVWQHRPPVSSKPAPPITQIDPASKSFNLPVVEMVQDVRSSMKQAVDELAGGVDKVRPILRGSVESVRDAADEIKVQASETWKQMRKPKSGTMLNPIELPTQLQVSIA